MSDATQTLQPTLPAETIEAIVVQTVAAMKDVAASQDQGGFKTMSAWVKKRKEEIERLGEVNAPWWCFWIDPDKKQVSRSCGPGKAGHKLAHQLKRKVEAELLLGTYGQQGSKTWEQFRNEYEAKVLPGLAPGTQRLTLEAMDRFERIVQPGRMDRIRTTTIDAFIAGRRGDPSTRNPEGRVSPATVNKDIRHLKAVLKKAWKWKYLPEVPDFATQREPKKLPAILEPSHFATLYQACEKATKPAGQPYPPADWWRGLLVTLYMVGWRVGAVLALKRSDIDLVTGTAMTRAADTKGRRDQRVPVHPVVIGHWQRLPGFTEELFPWPHHSRTLWVELGKLREAAGVPDLAFHAMKKAFCTLNAPLISEAALGFLAQHESPLTTKKHYINPTAKIEEAVAKLYVPEFLRKTGTEG